MEEWMEVPDVFSEGGGHREIYSVIFLSRGNCVCMSVYGVQWVVGGKVAGDFSLSLTYAFPPK